MNIARYLVGVVVVVSSIVGEANECVAPKPPKIPGALCGRLFDATGAAVPNVDLRVLGELDRTVADVQADSKGDFMFSNLAKGKYRLVTTSGGWLIEFGSFEITSAKATCMHPVSVSLDVACCCYGSGISKRRPPHY